MEHFSVNKNCRTRIAPIYKGIEYIDEGAGDPILFLHGAFANINTWRKIIPDISKYYRCIAINLPLGAHNLPFDMQTDLSPTGIAHIIHNFIQYLHIDSLILVANDTGNAYAQVFTSLYPQYVKKLILSNGEGLDIFPPRKFAYLRYAVQIPGFNYLMSRAFTLKHMLNSNMMLGLLSLTVTNHELYNLYVLNFVQQKKVRENFRSAASTWSSTYTMDAAHKLKDFNKPVLILWGDKDVKLFPITLGQRLKELFPYSQLIEIKNSRTYIQEDQPKETARHILQFITQET